jgi:hypothetical protein
MPQSNTRSKGAQDQDQNVKSIKKGYQICYIFVRNLRYSRPVVIAARGFQMDIAVLNPASFSKSPFCESTTRRQQRQDFVLTRQTAEAIKATNQNQGPPV